MWLKKKRRFVPKLGHWYSAWTKATSILETTATRTAPTHATKANVLFVFFFPLRLLLLLPFVVVVVMVVVVFFFFFFFFFEQKLNSIFYYGEIISGLVFLPRFFFGKKKYTLEFIILLKLSTFCFSIKASLIVPDACITCIYFE